MSREFTDEQLADLAESAANEWEHLQHDSNVKYIPQLAAEILRLAAEVRWLQDYGRIPQLETLLREAREDLVKQNDGERFESLAQILAWEAGVDAALGAFTFKAQGSPSRDKPSYVPPPADPLLAKPEKNR